MQVRKLTGDSHSQVKAAVTDLLLLIGSSSLQSLCNVEICEIFSKSLTNSDQSSREACFIGPATYRGSLPQSVMRFYCLISCMSLLNSQLVYDGL